MSLTRTVRPVAGLVLQSSRPRTPSLAVKNSFPANSASSLGRLAGVCGSAQTADAVAAGWIVLALLSGAPATADTPAPASVTAAAATAVAAVAARLAPVVRARRRRPFA